MRFWEVPEAACFRVLSRPQSLPFWSMKTMRMLHNNSRALWSFSCLAENVFQFIKSAGNSQVFSRRHRASNQCDSSGVVFAVFLMERLSSLQTFNARLVGPFQWLYDTLLDGWVRKNLDNFRYFATCFWSAIDNDSSMSGRWRVCRLVEGRGSNNSSQLSLYLNVINK